LDLVGAEEASCFEGVDGLVLATPLAATLELLARLRFARCLPPLVIDVASLQVPVAAAGAALTPFVPTHPIAGSELSGPEAGRPDLFAGRTWAYEPDRPAAARTAAVALIRQMGAVPFAVDAAVHDRAMALTSMLPQLVGTALACRLAQRLKDPAVADLVGPGMRSSVRLGASPWSMWRSILDYNRDAAAQEVRSLSAILSDVADALASGNLAELEPLFRTAAQAVAGSTANTPAADSVLQ
jgi:prephenate dehydrogenase